MDFQAHKSIILLVLLISYLKLVLLIEARPMKSMYKTESNAVEGKEDFRPTTPGDSPGVGHKEESTDEFLPHPPGSRPGAPNNSPPNVDNFRPTTPGNSPGVGHHSHVEDIGEREQESRSRTESDTDDFKPTNPGHSPGVGHADKN